MKALVKVGFTPDEARRAFDTVSERIFEALRADEVVHFRGMFKLWAVMRKPRRYWDNFNHRSIYFGERRGLKVRNLIQRPKPSNLMRPRSIK